MIIDGLLLFSSAQNVTTGDTVSSNVIDLLNARDMGAGTDLQLAMFVTTAFTSTDAATMTVQVQGSTDNSTWSTYAQSPAYSSADLTVNRKIFPIDWPALMTSQALPRYLRLNYAASTLHFTPGAVTSMLVLDREDIISYPAGINISN